MSGFNWLCRLEVIGMNLLLMGLVIGLLTLFFGVMYIKRKEIIDWCNHHKKRIFALVVSSSIVATGGAGVIILDYIEPFEEPLGTDYYINGTSGSDSNGGQSTGDAFATIQKGVDSVVAGGIVYIMEGIYNEDISIINNGSAGNIITICPYQTDSVIINGHGQLDSGYDGIIRAEWKHHYRITSLTIRNASYGDGSGTGSNQAYGILWTKTTTTNTIADITFDNLTIYNCTNSGIHMSRNSPYDGSWIDDVTIEYCTIYDTCNWPKGRTDPSGTPVNSANEGISILGVQNVTVQYNTIYKCGKECLDFKARVYNGIIRYNNINATNSNDNTTQDNPSNIGIYLDGISNVDEIQVYGNRIWGNGTGIQLGIEGTGDMDDVDFYNNICNMSGTDNPISFQISGQSYGNYNRIEVINNVFYSIGKVSVKIDESEADLIDFVFRNNIVCSNAYYEMQCAYIDQSDISIDNNSFWDVDASPEIKTDWQSDDSDYHGDDNITSDPKLKDVSTGKFWLQSTSPCIDEANPTGAPSRDILNVLRYENASDDIGAYETLVTSIRNDGLDYIVWMGATSSASTVGALITGFDDAAEYISAWKGGTWGSDGIWQKYSGTDVGTNWNVNTYDIIRIDLSDSGTQIIYMEPNDDLNYGADRTVSLTDTAVNKGFNYVGYSDKSATTLSDIAGMTTLATGETISWWNRTGFTWEGWVVNISPSVFNHDIEERCVIVASVGATRSFSIGG